jgi:hypothetical protein
MIFFSSPYSKTRKGGKPGKAQADCRQTTEQDRILTTLDEFYLTAEKKIFRKSQMDSISSQELHIYVSI